MAYSNVAQVRSILQGWSGDESFNNTPAKLNDSQLEYAIASADAEIDAALRRKYKVPFGEIDDVETAESIPKLVRTLSIDIACYQADLIFRNQTRAQADTPGILRYERARRILNELKTGRIEIDAIERIELDGGLSSVFQDYSHPLFPFSHIFQGGSEYSEGVFPDDRSHY